MSDYDDITASIQLAQLVKKERAEEMAASKPAQILQQYSRMSDMDHLRTRVVEANNLAKTRGVDDPTAEAMRIVQLGRSTNDSVRMALTKVDQEAAAAKRKSLDGLAVIARQQELADEEQRRKRGPGDTGTPRVRTYLVRLVPCAP